MRLVFKVISDKDLCRSQSLLLHLIWTLCLVTLFNKLEFTDYFYKESLLEVYIETDIHLETSKNLQTTLMSFNINF